MNVWVFLCVLHIQCTEPCDGHYFTEWPTGADKHQLATTLINKLAPKLFLIKISFQLRSNEFIMVDWGEH